MNRKILFIADIPSIPKYFSYHKFYLVKVTLLKMLAHPFHSLKMTLKILIKVPQFLAEVVIIYSQNTFQKCLAYPKYKGVIIQKLLNLQAT